MKKLNILSALSAVMLFSTSAFAITATGNASAIIKKSITASETQAMNFGTISSAAASGTVTMNTAGTRSSTLSYYGTSHPGIFTVTGEPSTALNITFSNSTLSNGSQTMALSNFTHASTPGSDTTDSSGNLTLNVGADLSVAANQASGSYSGTYTVTLSY